jgi:hypothetical protein
MRQHCWYLPWLSLVPICVSIASAQSAIDFNIGFGGAWNSASGGGIDNFNSPNAFGACTLGSKDPACEALPRLNAFMLGFGGDVMIKQKLGFGFDYSLQPNQPNYGPLQDRQEFYDFDAVFRPIQTKRMALNLEGGIGGSRTSFSINQNQCVGVAVCSNYTSPVGTTNHFQVHIGVGVQLFVTEHFFVRPEFDVHVVNGLTDVWGSNFVPAAMVWVGYNLGSK